MKDPADHGIGRSRGGLSRRLAHAAASAGSVARPAGRPRTHPEAALGEKAYSSRAIGTHLRARGLKAVISEPADQQGHRRRRGSAGGRPVVLDSEAE
ncbi:MAG: hypothetical protein R5N81_07005 [Cutibacterium granulosum]|uniref:hypothetical protein n=1 Tax=Cutibacterium granulosum TaxID=33011 RepID=UPI002B230BCD|nr:hypothetical protein [Cutibacterium granulosum]MEA5635932.1 hypothetical protein [Cutibacterium granulosum]